MKFGTATAVRIAMMATATTNSSRLKPSALYMMLLIFFTIVSPQWFLT